MYLLACATIMIFAVYQSLRMIGDMLDRTSNGESHYDMHQSLRGLGLSLGSAILMTTPILVTYADVLLFTSGKPVAMGDGNISVTIGLVGALAVVVAVVRGVRHRKKMGFWFTGWFLVSLLSAGIALIATASQLAFMGSPVSGVVSFTHFRDQVKDMRCESDVILMQWDQSPGSPVVYRCPKAYLLNRHTAAPFVPWPDYIEGRSLDLAAALQRVLEEAELNTPKGED